MQLLTQGSEECVTPTRAFEVATHSQRRLVLPGPLNWERGRRTRQQRRSRLLWLWMAVGGHAWPGSAADSTSRHRFGIEKAHLETARVRTHVT